MDLSTAPTERFSHRVADYVRCRPGYPAPLVPWLMQHCGLETGAPVADIGSGTGLFTRGLLAAGLHVTAIEPNAPMRAAAEAALAHEPRFASVDGTAEHTGLAAASVALVTAAQAFHWFDGACARIECARILTPGGHVALIWNVRLDDTPFLRAYEVLLRTHAPDYARSGVPAQADTDAIQRFFAPQSFVERSFFHEQRFDREGLRGRLRSSSYVPASGAPGHDEILGACDALFARHAEGGRVAFRYRTRAFVGRLA